MRKSQSNTKGKFETPYRLSAMCKYCTPDKPSGRNHSRCFNVNCICPHHGNWSALYAREKGLRTQSKPGDFDYKTKTDKPFVDDQLISGVNDK